MRLGKRLAVVLALAFTLMAGVANGQAVSDSDFLYFEPMMLNVSNNVDTNWAWPLMVDNSTTLGAIAVPLTFSGLVELGIDTTVLTPPDIKGVTYGPAGRSIAWTIKTSLIDNAAKTLLMGYISFSSFTATADTLCYVHFDLDASGQNISIDVDSQKVGTSNLTITDIFAQDYVPTWTKATLNVGGGAAVDDDGITPLVYGLDQNAPNPFNAQTRISFSMPKADRVNLIVFNVLGQHVKTVLDTKMDANRHEIVWDGTNDQGSLVASGTYFYRLKIGDAFEETRQMTLLK